MPLPAFVTELLVATELQNRANAPLVNAILRSRAGLSELRRINALTSTPATVAGIKAAEAALAALEMDLSARLGLA